MKRILIIDDDESIRTVFERFLTAKGYLVDCAADGKAGLRKLAANPPDLVITDIMMPETDGLEVVLSMRKNNLDIPVFAISGGMHSAPLDFLPMVRKFGAVKVFYKPVVLSELEQAIRETLA